MSMLGIAYLNEIISNRGNISAGQILDELRAYVIRSLHQSMDSGIPDGMDMALLIINKETRILQYAGAHNPLYLLRGGELIEYKADKMPIGIHANASNSFTNHNIRLQVGDAFYAFSDGFQDQFGGPRGKKFLVKNFKKLLQDIHKESMKKQKRLLEEAIDTWMANTDQIDDILVMGIRF
jgi:serine phosphatase RsbU (regulator of sigma subunit)